MIESLTLPSVQQLRPFLASHDSNRVRLEILVIRTVLISTDDNFDGIDLAGVRTLGEVLGRSDPCPSRSLNRRRPLVERAAQTDQTLLAPGIRSHLRENVSEESTGYVESTKVASSPSSSSYP
jgi:hypothetical protein